MNIVNRSPELKVPDNWVSPGRTASVTTAEAKPAEAKPAEEPAEAKPVKPSAATSSTAVVDASRPIRVLALVATVPERRRSCERLLTELARQTRPPDGVLLVLDGYGKGVAAPSCELLVVLESRSLRREGAGQRWLRAFEAVGGAVALDDVLVCMDDDAMLIKAPRFVEELCRAVETGGGAAAAAGRCKSGKPAPPGAASHGDLVHAAGCGLAVRVRHLEGLREFAADVLERGGPDALGPLGDDDALVSAYLWKRGVRVVHAAAGIFTSAPNTRDGSQTQLRAARGGKWDDQKRTIAKVTGWPFLT